MELRPGYKHTEIGIVPEDWEIKPVSELGEVTTGGTPSTIRSEFWNGSFPWVTPSDIGEHRDIVETERMITDAGLRAIRSLPKDSVLVTCIASIGKNAILRRAGGCNQQINAVIPNEKNNPEFLYYTFNFAKQYLLANSGITATRIISKSTFERLGFAVPPTTEEQYAIAEALSDADALIESMECLIAKKRAIKQGAMQELLSGRRRLPGFTRPWRSILLGELLSRLANGIVYTPIIKPGLPVTRIETIAEGFVDYSRTGNVDPTPELEKYKMQTGDILYSHINSIDHIGKVALYRGEKVLYHGMNLLLLRATENVDSRFLYYIFASEPLRQKARLLAKQAVSQASINTTELRSVELILPCYKEQRAIADVLDDVEGDLACCAGRLMKARQIKQGMMQELLTGRVRLL